MKCLNAIVPIFLVFSGVVSEGVGLTFSPAKVIFSGIGVLLQVMSSLITNRASL
ncbi:hypothetical protein BGW80DRAFT_1266760 [Lactifluus volemus]|nr:hypothetical protein BGW80DRAFT_1266760 [Lactifluus volemus]